MNSGFWLASECVDVGVDVSLEDDSVDVDVGVVVGVVVDVDVDVDVGVDVTTDGESVAGRELSEGLVPPPTGVGEKILCVADGLVCAEFSS